MIHNIKDIIQVNNVILTKNGIIPKSWCRIPHEEERTQGEGPDHTLICKVAKNKFKLISYANDITYVTREELVKYTTEKRVGNCRIKNGALESICTYTVITEPEFKANIDDKYNTFIAKTSLLGHNMSFKYIIEGTEVKLMKYTGTSKHVIVPKFITSIMEGAFQYTKIETLALDIGLKSIGSIAFHSCNISEITIPETVKFIGRAAFNENKGLMDRNGLYTNKLKLINPETVVIQI